MEPTVIPPDRRRGRRVREEAEHGIVRVRVRPGHAAVVIDVSPHGVLIETAHRLLPGTTVDLHLERAEGRESVRGRVLRSIVSIVAAGGISYRGAIRFESALTSVLTASPGGDAPSASAETMVHQREAATRGRGSQPCGVNANVE